MDKKDLECGIGVVLLVLATPWIMCGFFYYLKFVVDTLVGL